MVFRQYGFACAFSDNNNEQTIYDIIDICMPSLENEFSYDFSDDHLE